jgi:hypothetical protein
MGERRRTSGCPCLLWCWPGLDGVCGDEQAGARAVSTRECGGAGRGRARVRMSVRGAISMGMQVHRQSEAETEENRSVLRNVALVAIRKEAGGICQLWDSERQPVTYICLYLRSFHISTHSYLLSSTLNGSGRRPENLLQCAPPPSFLRARLLTNLSQLVPVTLVGISPYDPVRHFTMFFRRADVRCHCAQVSKHQSHDR